MVTGRRRIEVPFDESGSKRALYRIADPFFRMWFRVVAPNRGPLATMSSASRRALLAKHWPGLLGQSWEELCRDSVPRLGPATRRVVDRVAMVARQRSRMGRGRRIDRSNQAPRRRGQAPGVATRCRGPLHRPAPVFAGRRIVVRALFARPHAAGCVRQVCSWSAPRRCFIEEQVDRGRSSDGGAHSPAVIEYEGRSPPARVSCSGRCRWSCRSLSSEARPRITKPVTAPSTMLA